MEAPAREALALTGSSPSPASTKSAAHSAPPTAPPAAHTPVAPRSHPHAHPHPRPEHREPHRPAVDAPKRPRIEVPDVSESIRKEVPRGNSDLCGLGKKYGGWRADSPESRICEQTYGR